jgi:hypothetical protein
VDRKTGEKKHYFVRRAAVNVCGTIQPDVLARILTPELLDSGLAACLLMSAAVAPRKVWTEVELSEATEAKYAGLLRKLYALPFHKDRKTGKDRPYAIHLSPEAKALWVEFYNAFGVEQDEAEGELSAAFAKLEAYAARFALLHHVVIHVDLETDDTRMVGAKSMQAGITLALWFANEARRVYGMLGETVPEQKSRALVEFLRKRGGEISTKQQLQRSNSRKYKTAEAAEVALESLVLDGLAEWQPRASGVKGGRPHRACVLLAPKNTTDPTDRTPGEAADAADTRPTEPQSARPNPGTEPRFFNVSEGSVGSRTEENGVPHEGNGSEGGSVGSVGSVGREGVESDAPEDEGEL